MHHYSHYRAELGKSRIVRLYKRLFRNVDRKTLVKNLFLSGIALILLGAIVFLAAYAWYSKDLPDPNTLMTRDVALSTKIYDRTGTHLLYEIAGDKKRTLVTLDQIPVTLQHAAIAIEDANFYSHHGISVKGLLRAVLFGGTRGGGSTITQQLVKNAILTDERTIDRKFKEIILSLAIERNFTKEQILQMYFNEIAYGGRNYGIESAAQSYYGKHVTDLTLGQCATLAGLPQLPTTYLNNPDLLVDRRNLVLSRMVELGYITQAEADTAKAEDDSITVPVGDITAPHFVMWVKEQLAEKYGEREVEEGGLKIVTTLDYDKQLAAEQAVKDGVAARGTQYNFNNAGLVSVDPKTGQVLAMVGSADYFNDDIDGQVNVALRPLQPGSSIKPIIYAAAFEKGYTPNTLVWDVNTTFATATGSYNPHNYEVDLENGPITLRKALQGSLNVPAVKVLYLLGVSRALDFTDRLHYTTLTNRSNYGLSMVLGGAEVKLLEHANAYAAFANNGKQYATSSVLRVEDATGTVLEEWKAEDNQGTQVVDGNIAAMLSNVLSDNASRAYIFGEHNYLTLGDRPVAAKTGTTNDYNDAWTMGYTPSLVAGVWVGNTNGAEMKRGADGSQVAAPIWNAYMRAALAGSTVEGFPTPVIPVTGKAVLDGVNPTQTVTIDTVSGKLATTETPARFRKDVTCGEYHDILQYVDKDDPLGAAPSDPSKDPYYAPWEAAVQDFITRHNASLKEGEAAYESCTVPTEEDDVHTAKNKPAIDIRSPHNNDNVGRSISLEYEVETHRNFGRIEVSIDGTYVDGSTNPQATTVTLPTWVSTGTHTLTTTVYDDVDNEASDSVEIDVTEAPTSTAHVRITNPFNDQTIVKVDPTYVVSVETSDSANATQLVLTAKDVATGAITQIGSVTNPTAISSVTWTLPAASAYIVSATVTYADGATVDAEPAKVYVTEK